MARAVHVLSMLIVANSAAWIAGRFPSARAPRALDFGLIAWDGERLLGSHKSWRGLMAGSLASCIAGWLCSLDAWVAAGFGALSLLGDALSSAIKRRLRRPPGTDVPLLDQVPEALLPILLLWPWLALTWSEVAVIIAAFTVLDLLCTRSCSAIRWRPF
ncbi:MAG TPA: CDP-archaeol synthase [Steroidobacteraceae bacterium]|nr:CDP-archaeol synthase [Steroidobacteraceae bacterium]